MWPRAPIKPSNGHKAAPYSHRVGSRRHAQQLRWMIFSYDKGAGTSGPVSSSSARPAYHPGWPSYPLRGISITPLLSPLLLPPDRARIYHHCSRAAVVSSLVCWHLEHVLNENDRMIAMSRHELECGCVPPLAQNNKVAPPLGGSAAVTAPFSSQAVIM